MEAFHLRLAAAVAATGAALLGTTAGASTPVGGAAPVPVVTLVRGGMIEAFAQNGDRIVWIDSAQRRCLDVVRLRDLTTGKTEQLMAGADANVCRDMPASGYQHRMALAGTRALWVSLAGGNTTYSLDLYTKSLGQTTKRLTKMEMFRPDSGEWPLVPLAGDGPTLVYVNPSEGDGPPLGYGFVWRIPGGRVAGTYGTVGIAANDSSFAIARSASIPGPKGVRGWTGIEIRRTSDGRILRSFPTATVPLSLALGNDRVALLFHQTVELRTPSGSVMKRFAVDKQVSEISMSGRWIVFDAASTVKWGLVPSGPSAIQALDTDTGAVRTLARAAGTVVGLSIEGHRVAWAEQRDGPNVIRALTLP